MEEFIKNSLELLSLFVEHDTVDCFEDILHQDVLHGLLLTTNIIEVREEAYYFFGIAFKRFSWELFKEGKREIIDKSQKNLILKFMNEKVIERDYEQVFSEGSLIAKAQFIRLLSELVSY